MIELFDDFHDGMLHTFFANPDKGLETWRANAEAADKG